MSEKSLIEWTATRHEDGTVTPGSTWNPVLGCEKVSPGCANCYAVSTVWRMAHNPLAVIKDANVGLVEKQSNGLLNWTGVVRCLPARLKIPLNWKTPRRIFVNSQSDLFHPDVPDKFIDQVFAVMALCPRHTFQILTKRPERMAAYLRSERLLSRWDDAVVGIMDTNHGVAGMSCFIQPHLEGGMNPGSFPLPNVWLGVSVEDQKTADERIPFLTDTPCAVRFLSCEPLLGPLDLKIHQRVFHFPEHISADGTAHYNAKHLPFHWVIAGGESGSKARPSHPHWFRNLRDQCQAANIPFFFKQHGAFLHESQWASFSEELSEQDLYRNSFDLHEKGKRSILVDAERYYPMTKHDAGRLLDGREWNEMPEVKR